MQTGAGRPDQRDAGTRDRLSGAARILARAPAARTARARILDAMVLTVAERGFAGATITAVCARARVSRATFYDSFDGLRDCFVAVIDDGYRRARALITEAFAEECEWRAGVRAALGALLAFFDDEPLLARVWLLETLAAGSWALERRARHLAALTALITERWPLPEDAELSQLAAPAAIEAVLGIVEARLLANGEEPLVVLLGPLMGLIGTVYLGPAAAAVETERGQAHARRILTARQSRPSCATAHEPELPPALRNPRAHRARECLQHLAANPGSSNRQIASALGIARQEQISKILARLHALGLLVKQAAPPGGANAWSLTPYGTQLARALHTQPHSPSPHGGVSQSATRMDTYTSVKPEPAPSED
jgi:AcrR family transcriptional regulator